MSDQHQARKRFGQNFLSDPNIIRKIIEAIRPKEGERIGRDQPRPGGDDRAADGGHGPPARGRDRPRPDRAPSGEATRPTG